MVYVCELSPGHHVYLDNQENQTIITITLSTPGQQQQTSNSMTTGTWTALPEAYQTTGGAVLKLFTAQGEICIYIQNNSVSLMGEVPPEGLQVDKSQPLSVQQTTIAPKTTMQPMTMGNMQMTMNPMEMRMGNMELKIKTASQTSQTSQTSPSQTTRQFCSQCGAKVAPEDRFCSSCGHALS